MHHDLTSTVPHISIFNTLDHVFQNERRRSRWVATICPRRSDLAAARWTRDSQRNGSPLARWQCFGHAWHAYTCSRPQRWPDISPFRKLPSQGCSWFLRSTTCWSCRMVHVRAASRNISSHMTQHHPLGSLPSARIASNPALDVVWPRASRQLCKISKASTPMTIKEQMTQRIRSQTAVRPEMGKDPVRQFKTSESRFRPWVACSHGTPARQMMNASFSILISGWSFHIWASCNSLLYRNLPFFIHFWAVKLVKPLTPCRYPPISLKRRALRSRTDMSRDRSPPASSSFASSPTQERKKLGRAWSPWLTTRKIFRLTCLLRNSSKRSFDQASDKSRDTPLCSNARKLKKMPSPSVKIWSPLHPHTIFYPRRSRHPRPQSTPLRSRYPSDTDGCAMVRPCSVHLQNAPPLVILDRSV